MSANTPTVATVTGLEMILVLAWWSVLLAVPLVLIRRLRRRHAAAAREASKGDEAEASGIVGASDADVVHLAPPPPQAAGEGRARVSSSASSAPARLPGGTLEPLCGYVNFRRRLVLAVSELERKLAELPHDRWRVEPYPLTGERRNSVLVLGETGVFVISATFAPGNWDDLVTVSQLARKIQLLLPRYCGEVQPAICHPFTPARPRQWHRPDDHGDWIGAWVMGGDSVLQWLQLFGAEHGLSTTDLELFDRLAQPNWLRAAIPTPRSWPPIQMPPSGS